MFPDSIGHMPEHRLSGRLVSAVSPHVQGELEEIETSFAEDKFDRG